MAGIGEAGAIVGIITTAAQLSKALYEATSKYKNARTEIECFCRDLELLGKILNQYDRFFAGAR